MGDRHAAVNFYNAAIQVIQGKEHAQSPTHAYQLFSSACLVDPTFWEAHYQAGNNASDLENKEAAVALYRRALACETTDEQRCRTCTNLNQ